MHLSMSSRRVVGGGGGGRAKGRDLINRFGPGVGYLNYLAVPGVGIFEFSSCLGPQTLSGCSF